MFSDAVAELSVAPGDKLVVLLTAPGLQHEITMGLQTLSTDASVLLAAVVEPQIGTPAAADQQPPEGYDAQVGFDIRRAQARLFPAIAATSRLPATTRASATRSSSSKREACSLAIST